MSKVYFYSVSDILSEESDRRGGGGNNSSRPRSAGATAATSADTTAAADGAGYCSRGEADHVSVLDCETFHREQQVGVYSRNLYVMTISLSLRLPRSEGGRLRGGGGDLDAADGHAAAADAAVQPGGQPRL